jgi:tetrahydromethanopterin:alpha-L-glutamate ligase
MVDRLACTMTLSNAGIPMPDTIITESVADAFDAVKRYGGAVFKPLYSTKARGMEIIEGNWPEIQIKNHIEAFNKENPMMYIQKKLELSGKDYGMVFIGGKYHGTYARVSNNGAWNTTINSGGKYALHKPPQSTIDLAEEAQALFGMDFTTVDVADTPDGPIVFEVSAFGGFRGAKEGLGIDAADLYADYALRELEA